MKTIHLIALATLFFSCGNSGSDGAAPPLVSFENLSIFLTSNNGISLSAQPPAACEIDVGFGPSDTGICTTPLKVEGWASGIFLHEESGSTNSETAGGVRILGGGNGLDQTGSWEGDKFDFEDDAAIDGESTLEKVYKTKPTFTSITTELNYMSFKTQVGSNYWNVIVPFYSQPVEQNAIVQSCQYDEFYLSKVAENANLLPGLEFERGDFLFCIKSTIDDCKINEFKFFDTDSETFVASRPNAPKFSEYISELESGCAPPLQGESGASLDWGRFSVRADLTTPLKLYADYAFGDSSQNPDSEAASSGLPPYKIYYHEVDGAAQTGNDLKISFEFNTDNMIFFKDISDVSTLQNSTNAEIANKIIFQSLHQTEADPNGADTTPAFSATPSIVLQTLTTEQLKAEL